MSLLKPMLGALGVLLLAQAAAARPQQNESPTPPKPVTAPPNAEQIATTPLSDLNIKKDGPPAVLEAALADPYALDGLKSCAALRGAISALTAVLGPDVDAGHKKGKLLVPGKVAQDLVGGLIPFRGVVREITGANAEQRHLQQTIYAGFARRGFLKGVGLSRGCSYPARPE